MIINEMSENRLLRERIIYLICAYQGLKGTELVSKLATEFIELSTEFILQTIEQLIIEGEIVEIEYNLPEMSYRIKSFYLPKKTHVEVK